MLIGLTGGIACGKTTVAQRLSHLGATIIDADQIARDVVAPGQPGLQQVLDAFGAHLLTTTGELDRAALGQHIFGDAQARTQLTGILHPLIAQESQRQITAALAAKPTGLVVYDAALLFEAGRAEAFRPVVVVSVPPQIQRERLMARDGITGEAADQRINSQMPVAAKAAQADYVIENSHDRASTWAQVDALFRQLMRDP